MASKCVETTNLVHSPEEHGVLCKTIAIRNGGGHHLAVQVRVGSLELENRKDAEVRVGSGGYREPCLDVYSIREGHGVFSCRHVCPSIMANICKVQPNLSHATLNWAVFSTDLDTHSCERSVVARLKRSIVSDRNVCVGD